MENIDKLIEKLGSEECLNLIIDEFKSLPLNYQLEVLKYFASKINECKQSYLHDQAESICLEEGHQFSKWEKNEWSTFEDICVDHQIIHGYKVEHQNWKRVCSRCGFVEFVEREPKELINERKEKNRQARIKRLERELKHLKSE